MASLLFFRDDFGNGNEDFDGKQAHAVLVVLCKVLEEGYHFVDDDGGWHLLYEFGHVGGRLSSDHGCLIVDQEPELLAQLDLNGRGDLLVGRSEETASRNLRGKPVCLRETDGERDEVFLDLLGRQLLADLVERLDGLSRLCE